jgi:diaminohydroxyphosphoribosylaminopyrimidine deaminase/5-amino-6-(5-phosphoribosylamino)uracil reductase
MRAKVDAVLVGSGTVLADDPRLTARLSGDGDAGRLAARQPLRVVLDRRGRAPRSARVFDAAAPTVVLDAPDPRAALDALHGRGVRHVLLEGGATLAGAFIEAGCVDEAVAYIAPVLLGAGPPALGPAGIGTMSAALRLSDPRIERLGPDVRITGYIATERIEVAGAAPAGEADQDAGAE